ncbi:hypothetical protein ACFQI3_15995 [Hansschlegelia quercus]|nr:hypothetical protein [Hansschlegelia quercus]
MTDNTLRRFERRQVAVEYGSSAAIVAMWGMGLWVIAQLLLI